MRCEIGPLRKAPSRIRQSTDDDTQSSTKEWQCPMNIFLGAHLLPIQVGEGVENKSRGFRRWERLRWRHR
jgi:hypothetical protein